ncbi:Calx-beta domain-containing protein [Azohydromonas aeria]|uniref:Calx-beta domain-containing protein n=1 Tax=Azohydromonas aeria TaxID=2590212 RepID=UPI0018DF5C73|nr:Calx-beta domain-containing protein [Azohydromonas aeria]
MAILIDDVDVDESQGVAVFTLRLDQARDAPVSVRWATANGSARAGSDYAARAGTVSFEPGQLTRTVSVPLFDNPAREGLELFKVTLSDPVNDVIGRGTAWAAIHDDDAPAGRPVIRVADTVVDDSLDQAIFTLTLDRPSDSPVRVTLNTANGTAIGASWGDYLPLPARTVLTFQPGEVVKTVAVDVPQHTWPFAERSLFFDLNLSSPVGASLPDTSARAFIAGAADLGSDSLPMASVSDVLVDEGAGLLRFVVTLSQRPYGASSVDFRVSGVTAFAGSDFVAQSGTLVFGPRENTRIVTVPLLDDRVAEGEEVLRLTLSSPRDLVIGDGTGDALGVIRDNDAAAVARPVIRVDDGVVDGFEPFARFNVWLDKPGTQAVTVRYATADASALNANSYGDYSVQGTQTLVFAPGEVVKTVLVPLGNRAVVSGGGIEDAVPMKYFDLLLSGATNATLGDARAHMVLPAQAEGTTDTPRVRGAASPVGENGTTLDVAVMLDAASWSMESVRYTVIGGTARAGVDFVAQSGFVNFAPGQLLQMLRIPLLNDALAEGTETLQVNLFANGAATPVVVQARILDDERPDATAQTLRGPADVGSLLVGQPGTTLVVGGAGNDLLDGVGAVTLRGGAGDDGYIVDAANNPVQEWAGGGTDTVYAYVNHALDANVERLVLADVTPLRGTGNALDNSLQGNLAANVLDGAGGKDRLWGGAGDDTLNGGDGDDELHGQAGFDVLNGGAGNDFLSGSGDHDDSGYTGDVLNGNEGNDRLSAYGVGNSTLDGGSGDDVLIGAQGSDLSLGGIGNDSLEGGAGLDTLIGGAGADTYGTGHYGPDHADPDLIQSWVSGEDKFVFHGFGGFGGPIGAVLRNAPGNFSARDQLVIFTRDIDGPITAESAAGQIGSATESYRGRESRFFVVDDGTATGVLVFTNRDDDRHVEADELRLLAFLDGMTRPGDYLMG